MNLRQMQDRFLREVWKNAAAVGDLDPAEWRRDDGRSLMRFSDYGLTFSEYGWTVQHIVPLGCGGRDIATNCRPRHIRRPVRAPLSR